MKKILSIEPVISTSFSSPYGQVYDVGDCLDLEKDQKVNITRIGCRIDKVEPKETYCMYYFFHAMRPGWKGDYQEGWSWDTFFTCTCGHGGCAGYHENVRIHRKKKTVRVAGQRRFGYTDGVVGTGDQVVYFDKVEWDAVLAYYVDLFRKDPDGIFHDNDIYFTGRYGLAVWG